MSEAHGYLWTLPLVGALVGWATNWLAVRMLFRPRRPVNLGLFTLQGLIPRRRTEIARSVAGAVEAELLSGKDIRKLLASDDLMVVVEVELDQRVGHFLREKIEELPSIARVMISPDVESRLRRSVVKHVMESIPEVAERLEDEIESRLNVKQLVETRMNSFPIERLEAIVVRIASRELHAIELWGAVIGALVGAAQWGILTLLA